MKIKKYLLVVMCLVIIIFIVPQTRQYVKSKFIGMKGNIFLLHVGQLNMLADRIDHNKDITIFGYLIKDKNKYYIVPDENRAKINLLIQASQIVLLMGSNKESLDNLDASCINRYVKVTGRMNYMIDFNTINSYSSIQTIERNMQNVVCPIQ